MACIVIVSTAAIQGYKHIPFDKADQVLQRTHGLGRVLVEVMAEGGVEGDVSPIIKNPDGMLAGLLTVLPELKTSLAANLGNLASKRPKALRMGDRVTS